MAVLIDPPTWPAHGTVFSHLVSDTSLEELHQLAEVAGVHPRAFDRDHYDVPERLYAACVAAGAVEASTRAVVAALRASGLRRTKATARAETEARRARLLARWPLPGAEAVAVDLLDRWGARGRYYHDLRHLEHCLTALDALGCDDPVVALAAWFHDAVYEGRAGEDEEASARLAEERLGEPADEVARLVRLTAGHVPRPGDARGEALCDVDLAILGADRARYDAYRRDVRREYADVWLADFRRGRLAVLDHLAALDPLFRTARGRELWGESAAANLAYERALLVR